MDAIARRKAAQQAKYGTLTSRPSEVERVLALPRNTTVPAFDLSSKLRPNQKGITLRPVQEHALSVIASVGGLVGAIGVGHGKSYIALLAGLAGGADSVVVLVSPATVPYMLKLLEDLERRYKMPRVRVVSWGRLSAQDAGEMLNEWSQFLSGKGMLVADEAHFARNQDAARTRRLRVWLDYHPHVKFVALSGTLTTRRLTDFAWIANRALGDRSPVPAGEVCAAWDRVLANEMQAVADFGQCRPLLEWAGSQNVPKSVGLVLPEPVQVAVRQAFGERLRSAPGVVVTDAASCDASLYICGLPAGSYTLNGLRKQAEQIAQTYRDPAGVELADDSEIIRTAKRLSMGYYYQWEWPAEPDYEWMEKRQKWSRLCRWIIQDSGGKDFDTRGLVEAAARKEIEAGRMSNWVTCYAEWAAVEKRVTPAKKVTWVSEEPLRVCVAWAERYKPCILWYDEEAVADKLLEMGVRVVRAGEKVPDQYAGPIALSVTAHGGAGLNLQFWSRQVFTCVPANGAAWEQILGRTHRQGQQSDEVWAWVPQWAAPLRHPLQKAREDAAWIESSMGNKQKLLLATFLETCPTSGRVVSK